MTDQVDMSDAAMKLTSDEKVEQLLGGRKVLGRQISGPLEAHDLLVRGLPPGALRHLITSLLVIQATESLGKAVGMSLRAYQRRQGSSAKALNPEQSGRAWKFARVLSRATAVFGTQEEAEHWLERPAVGLEQRRPIDLLATPVGVEIVEDHLTRLEYGVYT
jgi:putative toxin-antitoxin system antitoxin component (TIGR02293 family)